MPTSYNINISSDLNVYEPKLPTIQDATRYNMYEYLPIMYQDDPSGKLEPFLEVCNAVIEQIRKYLVRFPRMLDADEVPEKWISDLGTIVGADFDRFAPTIGSKRKKIKALMDLYKRKGLEYCLRFVWQEYGIHKEATVKSMADHIMVLSQQGGLSVEEDRDADYLSYVMLHDFGDTDRNLEWIGMKSADRTIDNELVTIKQGSYSGKGLILSPSWERMYVPETYGKDRLLWDVEIPQGAGDATTGWHFFGAEYESNHVYFAPSDITCFVRYKTNHTQPNKWRLYDSTAWDYIEMAQVIPRNIMSAFYGCTSDGKWIYYAPYTSEWFVRYDISKPFTDPASWQRVSMNRVFRKSEGYTQGVNNDCTRHSFRDRYAFTYCDWDGKWVYYSPNYTDFFLRFRDSSTFTGDIDAKAWEAVRLDRATDGTYWPDYNNYKSDAGSWEDYDNMYYGAIYENPHMYFVPMASRKFIRFNIRRGDRFGSFADATCWNSVHKSRVLGYTPNMATTTYVGGASDGRHIYFVPRQAEKLVRFDTDATGIEDPTAWQQMAPGTVMDSTADYDDMYNGAVFDGRYIYYIPDKANTIIRFDTQSTYFQTANEWDQCSLVSAMGRPIGNSTYAGGAYDGQYIYFTPMLSEYFMRYDSDSFFDRFIDNWQPKAIWRTTNWPRRYRLQDYGQFTLWINVPDWTILSPNDGNMRLFVGLDDDNVLEYAGTIAKNGWTKMVFTINLPHDSTGLPGIKVGDSTNTYDLSNLYWARIELLLNPKEHKSSFVYFDELKWIDPASLRGQHGAYLQDGNIHHEGSVVLDTGEWPPDVAPNFTLKSTKDIMSLIEDVWPLGMHPWVKFKKTFIQEVYPDMTANWHGIGTTRYKIWHRRTDMNNTWILCNDDDFTLEDHGHVTDEWNRPGGPHLRHRSPGCYIGLSLQGE